MAKEKGVAGYPKEVLRDLIDGKLETERIKEIMVKPKDAGRFEKVIEILQERVSWKEQILLPISDRLFIVQKGKERIVLRNRRNLWV